MSCRCVLLLFILDSYHPDSLLAKIKLYSNFSIAANSRYIKF